MHVLACVCCSASNPTCVTAPVDLPAEILVGSVVSLSCLVTYNGSAWQRPFLTWYNSGLLTHDLSDDQLHQGRRRAFDERVCRFDGQCVCPAADVQLHLCGAVQDALRVRRPADKPVADGAAVCVCLPDALRHGLV